MKRTPPPAARPRSRAGCAAASWTTLVLASCGATTGHATNETWLKVSSYVQLVEGRATPPLTWLDTQQALRRANDRHHVEVFVQPFDPLDHRLADETLELLLRVRERLQSLLGVEPRGYGVFLHVGRSLASDEPIHLMAVHPADRNATVIPMPVRGGRLRPEERFHLTRMHPHEWTESTLSALLVSSHPVPYGDPPPRGMTEPLRWVVDGLAELAGHYAALELAPASELLADLERREEALGRLRKTPSLRTWNWNDLDELGAAAAPRRGGADRYTLAFALWLRIFEQCGETGIREFVSWLLSLPPGARTHELCARKLFELTGLDVAHELDRPDVQADREALRRAIVRAKARSRRP